MLPGFVGSFLPAASGTPKDIGGPEVERFLTGLAVDRLVSAGTQNQALSALLFLYRQVLAIDLPWLDSVVRAKRTRRVPVVLSQSEAPAGVKGTFAMKVQATGIQSNQTFLNSELDYRDQRNLTVAITPRAAQQLARRLGEHPLVALEGKDILVRGAAVRTTIYLSVDGRMTDRYYHQTHVNVTHGDQITVR